MSASTEDELQEVMGGFSTNEMTSTSQLAHTENSRAHGDGLVL